MAFLDHVLQPPAYGWQDENGDLVKPSSKQIWHEFFSRLNVFKDRKNWLGFFSWLKVICLVPFFYYLYLSFLVYGCCSSRFYTA